MQNDVIARRLAWASLAGQGLFTLGWIVGGALDADYSHVRNDIASLGGRTAEHGWIGTAAMVCLALSIAVLGPAIARTVPSHRRLAGGAFLLAGLATLGWAVLPVDCDLGMRSCRDRYDAGLLSSEHVAHMRFGLAMTIAILATAFVLALALWPRPAAALALGSGVYGLLLSVAVVFAWDHGANGVVDRLSVLAMHVWLIGVALGVLWATRPAPREPRPTPLRPRDFFGRDWSGTGEVTLAPFWLWRRRPHAFRISRTATWLADEAWTFEDHADFGNGWAEARTRFCRFVSPTQVRVISSDMPDGADVLIGEDGYRIMPFRMVVPFGPLPLPVLCHDEGLVAEDGTLVETVELSFAGIRVARVVMRVHAVPPATAGSAHAPVAVTP